MSPKSSFPQDVKKEQVLSSYLDSLYGQLGMHFERITDKAMQNRGVDIIVTKNEHEFLVDEKAQLDYIGRSLETFAFEIGYFKDGVYKNGWLFDEKKVTTHYMLVTDIYLKESVEQISADGIASLSLLWVNRSKLRAVLESKGLGKANCEQAEKHAREHGPGRKGIPTGQPGHYFVLSDQKIEAPFNLVIGRDWLLKIGTQIYPKGAIVSPV